MDERIKSLVRLSSDLLIIGNNGTVHCLAAEVAERLAWAADEIPGLPFADFFEIDSARVIEELVREFASGSIDTAGDFLLTSRAGRPVRLSLTRLDESSIAVSLTEGSRARGWLENLMTHAELAAFVVRQSDTTIVEVTPGFERLFGYEPEEILGRSVDVLNDPSAGDPTTVAQTGAAQLERSGFFESELQNVRADGEPLWCRIYSFAGDDPLHGPVWLCLNQDITEQVLTRKALATSEARHRTVIELLTEGVIAYDASGAITACNPAAERILGVSAREIAGQQSMQPSGNLIRENGRPFPDQDHPAQVSLRSGRPCRNVVMGIEIEGSSGETIWIRVNSQPVLGEGERSLAVVVSFADITRERLDAEELLDAKHRAEAASRAKSEFVATMSHEIRTPLNGLLGLVSMLSSAAPPELREEFIDDIDSSGTALLTVIEDILDFSKIEAGHLGLVEDDFDLHRLCEDLQRLFRAKSVKRGLSFRLDIEPSAPSWVRGDAGRLRQILLNLLSNAFKFTDAGEILLHLDRVEDGQLRFVVRDSGTGMSQQAIERVFEPFHQVDSSAGRRHGGTGLGLAITKRLVKAMRGKIAIHSQIGEGCEVQVSLPLPEVESPIELEPEPVDTSAATVTLRGRILVAEDEPVNRRVFELMLHSLGAELDLLLVEDGDTAVERAKLEVFDLILMDVQMPGCDGFEATQRIRAEGASAQTPIVAVTANVLAETRDRCRRAGMNDFLSKPVRPEQVRKMLARWLG